MSETVRAFIAVEFSPDIKQTLKRVQDHFRPLGLDVKWVKPDNIHLTLKFLGHITEEKLGEVKTLLPQIFNREKAVTISIDSVGVFPRPRSPRVIWVGIKDNAEVIKKWATWVEDSYAQLGFEKEAREFTAHLTIGRVRSPRNAHLLASALEKYAFPGPLTQTVNAVTLFQSTLTPQGPIYTSLMKVDLS